MGPPHDRSFVPFGFSFLDKTGIHLFELMPFTVNGDLKILFRVLYPAHHPQMSDGVDGFRPRRSPEQFGDLGMTHGIGFGGEGKIGSAGLAFASECSLKIFLS